MKNYDIQSEDRYVEAMNNAATSFVEGIEYRGSNHAFALKNAFFAGANTSNNLKFDEFTNAAKAGSAWAQTEAGADA